MRLSPDGTKFVTSDELPGTYENSPKQVVSLWDMRTGQYRTLPDGLQSVGTFSSDGKLLALDESDADGYDHAVKLFDTDTGREKLSIPVRDKAARLYIASFSSDGRLMAGDYTVYERPKKWDKSRSWHKWYDVATGREVMSFALDGRIGSNCCFSPNDSTFAAIQPAGQKVQMLLFSVADKKLSKTLLMGKAAKGTKLVTSKPAFSPDGRWLAVTTQAIPNIRSAEVDVRDLPQPRIHLIDVAAGAIRKTLISPPGLAHAVCGFSPDGRFLATGGQGRILLWDMAKVLEATKQVRNRN
jgi:WD40 repeat protein